MERKKNKIILTNEEYDRLKAGLNALQKEKEAREFIPAEFPNWWCVWFGKECVRNCVCMEPPSVSSNFWRCCHSGLYATCKHDVLYLKNLWRF